MDKPPLGEAFLGSYETSTRPARLDAVTTAEIDAYLERCSDVLVSRAIRKLLDSLDSDNEVVALRAACKLLDLRLEVYRARSKDRVASLFEIEDPNDPFRF